MGNNNGNLIVLGILLITIVFIYISLPFIFRGPAAPFFVIHNHDTTSHEVTVEVFDQKNKPVINETYGIEPKSDISRSRPFSLKFHRDKREYIFKVTMDKKITQTVQMEMPHRQTLVDIRLYNKDYKSDEIIPISMDIEAIV